MTTLSTITRNAYDRLFRADQMVVAGQSPYDIVFHEDLVTVRHYRALTEDSIVVDGQTLPVEKKRHAVPLVIVSPLAVNMLVYDLFPERSFVKYLLARGFDVYLVEWNHPSRRHAKYTPKHYINRMLPKAIEAVRKDSGATDISLHGWSMGGIMSAAYVALGDPHVRNLITVGSPVDGHANGSVGRQYAALAKLLKATRFDLRKLPPQLAYSPGWANVIGFKLLDPVSSAKGYWSLIKQLHDRAYVEQHANQAAFIDDLEAYPGGVMRDWMCSVWLDNEVAKGRFRVGREVAHFERIGANLLCIAGKNDALSNVACCKPMLNVVGSADKTFYVGPGGHIGIISGKEAVDTIWKTTADWLAERSAQSVPTGA